MTMITNVQQKLAAAALSLLISTSPLSKSLIAIDAGHGGTDTGSIGRHLGIYEKNVTIAIAQHLKDYLNADPNFRTMMIRQGDASIPTSLRAGIARRAKADYIISIHADISENSEKIHGAHVLILSNDRANKEMSEWLTNTSSKVEQLGQLSQGSKSSNIDLGLLDMQFSYTRISSSKLASNVLTQLEKVGPILRNAPKPQDLSVLSAPDIPGVLVETGFLSSQEDEKRLSNPENQVKIARAIYKGIVNYMNITGRYKDPKSLKQAEAKSKSSANKTTEQAVKNPQKSTKSDNRATTIKAENNKTNRSTADSAKGEKSANNSQPGNAEKPSVNLNATVHVVAQDQTLYSIARLYQTTPEALIRLNNIKDNKIIVGQKLKLK